MSTSKPTSPLVPPTGVYTATGTLAHSTGEMAERYLPLVKSIVAKMRMHLPPSMDVEDVYGIGVSGLMQALHHYDPKKGTAFGAYASLRIRGAILDELRRLDWLPRRMRSQARQLGEVRNQLTQALGREPKDDEIAEALGLTTADFRQLEEQVQPITIVNLDKLFGDDAQDSGGSLHEAIEDRTQPNARDRIQDAETVALIREGIEQLPDIQRKILAMYYFEDMRLAEIAAAFQLSESRISQIHSKAIAKLRTLVQRLDR